MSNKKDLTRIEDLGEFVHELDESQDLLPDTDFSTSDLPDLPQGEESSFETEFTSSGDLPFDTAEESEEEETFENSLDFGSEIEAEFQTELNSDFSSDASTFDPTGSSDTEYGSGDFHLETTSENLIEGFESEKTKIEPLSQTSTWQESPLESLNPTPVYTQTQSFQAPENFSDLKKFSENSNFSGMSTEGNPSFSILIKNVRFIEDVNDITSLLKEVGLLNDSEDQVKARLMRGMLLVPRISEYAAIYLSHKLRRFDIDIQIGLSDEIHPPKHQETPETGIVSKFNLYQNQNHHFQFDDPKLELSQIIVAATSTLEGYQVLRYLGVASEHKILDSHVVEDEINEEIPRHYQELAQKLKAHALKAQANAVVGLNYQLTPIPSEFGMGGHKYRLTCTGNLVWVNKL